MASELGRIVVIGGGPAGLTAAIAAAEAGRRVVICEQLDRPGAKLLASGGGRCNLSNTLPAERFMAAFGRQGRFMAPALAAMDCDRLRQFLARLAVPTVLDDDGLRVYPASQSALDVQTALWQRCRELAVQVRLKTRVNSLMISPQSPGEPGPPMAVDGVVTGNGPLAAQAVIVACGGRGYRALGGGDSGYELAASAGHAVVPPTPALVPLLAAPRWVRRCAGIALSDVRVWIDLPRQPAAGSRGQVMFTHRGLSGPAVLNISGDVAGLLGEHRPVPLRIDLLPDADSAGLVEQWVAEHGGRLVRRLLSQVMPARLAETVLQLARIDSDIRAAEISRAQRDALAGLLAGLPVDIRDTEGFEHAMVTRGGVALKQVDPWTLASRLVGGLYFAGEVLDLAGPTGGFNLQWAFSSGQLAGASAGIISGTPY